MFAEQSMFEQSMFVKQSMFAKQSIFVKQSMSVDLCQAVNVCRQVDVCQVVDFCQAVDKLIFSLISRFLLYKKSILMRHSLIIVSAWCALIGKQIQLESYQTDLDMAVVSSQLSQLENEWHCSSTNKETCFLSDDESRLGNNGIYLLYN